MQKRLREALETHAPRLLVAGLIAAAAAAIASLDGTAATPRPDVPPANVRIGEAAVYPSSALDWQLKRLGRMQERTRACERALGSPITPSSTLPVRGVAYARWLVARWQGRAEATCRLARRLGRPVPAIIAVWGTAEAPAALAVSRCESGYRTEATNGQYLGLFQMGAYARSRFGHGSSALAQALAAHAYYVSSGRDWSPWSCKPWGAVQ